MKINFKVLSTFLAVAEHASFRKAAERMHLSLPAVSMQISQLEERLGVALFHRTTRRVELTREGEQLMIGARKAMAELDDALTGLQQVADMQRGQLTFACVPTVAGTRLPGLLTKFAQRHPGISVRVRELAQPDLLEAVRRREVDFGIGPQALKPDSLHSRALFDDDYVALLPADHPAAQKKGISLRELARSPLLTLGESEFRRQLLEALKAEGIACELNYEFTHVSTTVAMVEAGLGVGILPAVAVPAHGALKAIRIMRPAMRRTIAIITMRGHALSPSALRFVEMCDQLAPPRANKTSPNR